MCMQVAGLTFGSDLSHISNLRVALGIAADNTNVSDSMMSNRVANICSSHLQG